MGGGGGCSWAGAQYFHFQSVCGRHCIIFPDFLHSYGKSTWRAHYLLGGGSAGVECKQIGGG